jgi:hypothetical protein
MPNAPIRGVWQLKGPAVSQRDLRSFDNFSGLDAAGTDLHTSVTAGGKLDPDGLKIRVKSSSGFVVSV